MSPILEKDIDISFKRCILEYMYVSLMGKKVTEDYKNAVAENIVGLLAKIDSNSLEEFKQRFFDNPTSTISDLDN